MPDEEHDEPRRFWRLRGGGVGERDGGERERERVGERPRRAAVLDDVGALEERGGGEGERCRRVEEEEAGRVEDEVEA